MSEETFWRVVGIFSIVAVAIGGALWRHILEDAKTRERLAKLETDNDSTKVEVKTLRQHLHDLRDTLPQKVKELVEWFRKSG